MRSFSVRLGLVRFMKFAKIRKMVCIPILIGGFSAVLGLSSSAQVVTTTVQQPVSMTNWFPAAYPNEENGYSNNLTIGGPADIWTAVEFDPATLPAGAVVTNFSRGPRGVDWNNRHLQLSGV
jgi:hypothetical protein